MSDKIDGNTFRFRWIYWISDEPPTYVSRCDRFWRTLVSLLYTPIAFILLFPFARRPAVFPSDPPLTEIRGESIVISYLLQYRNRTIWPLWFMVAGVLLLWPTTVTSIVSVSGTFLWVIGKIFLFLLVAAIVVILLFVGCMWCYEKISEFKSKICVFKQVEYGSSAP